jgi:hypothetical protein
VGSSGNYDGHTHAHNHTPDSKTAGMHTHTKLHTKLANIHVLHSGYLDDLASSTEQCTPLLPNPSHLHPASPQYFGGSRHDNFAHCAYCQLPAVK